jgi:hypothetical protein
MSCADLITQYAEESNVFHNFTINQHWANGNVGTASGWLQLMPSGNGGPVYNWVGQPNFSYDPFNRNPATFHVASNGDAWMAYYHGSGATIGTQLINVECVQVSGKVFLVGTEQVKFGPSDPPELPTFDVINLWTLPILKLSKDIIALIKGAT